jgi:tight adherence protein C
VAVALGGDGGGAGAWRLLDSKDCQLSVLGNVMALASQEFITICIFMGVAAGTYALLALFDPYWFRVRQRVRELQGNGDGASTVVQRSPSTKAEWIRQRLAQVADPQAVDRTRMLSRLARAGIYHPNAVSRILIIRLVCTVVPAGVAIVVALTGYLRMDRALLIGCVLGGSGTLAPGLWLDRRASSRHIRFRASLPDFLDLMVVCLEGGLSLQETIRRVSDELRLAHPELAVELSIVQRDIELGATVDQALKRFATRSDYEGVRTLGTFIRETQKFGTNITEALRGHADLLRSQREQVAEENAQKASVKILIPTMLLIFPAIFVVLVGPAAMQIYRAFGKE